MLAFSLLFKIGNANPWMHNLYAAAKASNYSKISGNFEFDHTLFLQDHKLGFWYDSNNWNFAFYVGSLPQPPCNQFMLWLVVVHPIEMTMEQSMGLNRMFRLKPSRALQFFNNRMVKIGK